MPGRKYAHDRNFSEKMASSLMDGDAPERTRPLDPGQSITGSRIRSRSTMSRKGLSPIGHSVLATSLMLATAAIAQDQAKPGAMPDAQIEANVLRALASAPELSTQNIQSSTVYGTVTLTGNVHDDTMRTKAENLVARAPGVKKVLDELSLGDTPAAAEDASAQDQGAAAPANGGQLQSDGSYAPAPPASEQAESAPPNPQDQTYNGQQPQPQPQPSYQDQQQPQQGYPPQPQQGYPPQPQQDQQSPDASQYPGGYGPPQGQQQPYGAQQGQQPYGAPQGTQQYPGGYGPPQGQYPNQAQQQPYGPPQGNQQYPGYGPPQGQYPNQAPYGAPQRRPLYNNGPEQGYAPPGGQQAGLEVTVPAGATLRIRINRGLDSNHLKPGTPFDGTVLNDIPADGAIAIPRGATVQGTVIDAEKSGALSGRGELSLQINSITLGGANYPLTTELWAQHGRDKSTTTVNSALGLGALGAIFGGIAGGGAGAAIGAAAGAGVGVAGSASSPSGRVIVPPEAVITFRLAEPAVVKTVSEQEMGRLAYAAPANPQQPPMRRYYSPYYGYYYAPYYYGR